VINTSAEDAGLAGNEWLDACAAKPGNNVVVALFNTQNVLVFAAEGLRSDQWVWSPTSMTAGQAGPDKEYSVKLHEFPVDMDNFFGMDKDGALMVTSRIADPPEPYACDTSMGDGYGIGIFTDTDSPKAARLLVMGHRGGTTGNVRMMAGFSDDAEIAFNGGEPMTVCDDGDPNTPPLKPFAGTFVMAVF
jgi:hypothetical protein